MPVVDSKIIDDEFAEFQWIVTNNENAIKQSRNNECETPYKVLKQAGETRFFTNLIRKNVDIKSGRDANQEGKNQSC